MLSPPFASQLHLFATCIPHGAFACHTRVFPATHTLPLNAFPCHMHVLTTCVLFPYTLPCHMYSLATPLPHYAYTHNFTFPMNSQTRGSWAPPLCFRGNFPSSVTSATFVNAHFPHSGLLLFQGPLLQLSPQLTLPGRTFMQAHPERSILLVLSALAVIPTGLSSVLPLCYGITPSPVSLFAPTNSSPYEMASQSVVIGNVIPVAPLLPMMSVISAQAVLLPPMEPRSALELRKSLALTPYKPQAWEALLSESGLSSRYPFLTQNLHTGFLINIPKITSTQTPPNKSIITEYEDQFNKIVTLELLKQQYIGPFSHQLTKSLIGPFQSSPFSIIPKSGKPDHFWLLQNYSFPHITSLIHPNPSINSLLNSDEFPTTWGTFSIISLLIHQLPPHSQVATRDVVEAYRTIPLHHSQWPGTVVRTGEDTFCVDTTASFGFSPSAGVYGIVANAGADLFRYQGIGPLAK